MSPRNGHVVFIKTTEFQFFKVCNFIDYNHYVPCSILTRGRFLSFEHLLDFINIREILY